MVAEIDFEGADFGVDEDDVSCWVEVTGLCERKSAFDGDWCVNCGFRRMEDTLVVIERPPDSTAE